MVLSLTTYRVRLALEIILFHIRGFVSYLSLDIWEFLILKAHERGTESGLIFYRSLGPFWCLIIAMAQLCIFDCHDLSPL